MAAKKATKATKGRAAPARPSAPAGEHVCPGRGEPCGTDLAPLIAKGPKDGQEHTVECPACHTLHSYTAPGRTR